MRASSIALALALLASACASTGSGDRQAPSGPWAHSLFARVPASTPYAIAATAVAWEDVAVAMGPEAQHADGLADATEALIPWVVETEEDASVMRDTVEMMRAVAPLATEQGWRDAGLALPLDMIVYGVGLWPAVRVAVDSAPRATAAVADLLTRLGVPHREERHPTGPWIRVGLEPWVGIIAVRDDELVAALADHAVVDLVTDALLGPVAAAETLADSGDLQAIVDEHGFLMSSHGYAHAGRILRRLLVPEPLDAPIAAALELPDARTGACDDELSDLTAAFPRVALGYWAQTPRTERGGLVVELDDPEISRALETIAHPRGGLAVEPWPDPGLSLSVALDVVGYSKLFGLLTQRLVARQPQCAPLAAMAAAMQDQAVDLAMSARMLFGGLRAAHLRVPPTMDGEALLGGAGEAMVAVVHDSPLSVLRLLAREGGFPVPTADDGVPVEIVAGGPYNAPILAAVRGDLAVVTMGADSDARRDAVLSGGTGGGMPLLSMRYGGAVARALESLMGTAEPSFVDLARGAMAHYPLGARITEPVATVDGVPISADAFYERASQEAFHRDVADADGLAAIEAEVLADLVDGVVVGTAIARGESPPPAASGDDGGGGEAWRAWVAGHRSRARVQSRLPQVRAQRASAHAQRDVLSARLDALAARAARPVDAISLELRVDDGRLVLSVRSDYRATPPAIPPAHE